MQDVRKAEELFDMQSDLQLTYLITPVTEDLLEQASSNSKTQWHIFVTNYDRVVSKYCFVKKAAKRCGLCEHFVNRIRSDANAAKDDDEHSRVARRFFTALVLHELISVS